MHCRVKKFTKTNIQISKLKIEGNIFFTYSQYLKVSFIFQMQFEKNDIRTGSLRKTIVKITFKLNRNRLFLMNTGTRLHFQYFVLKEKEEIVKDL